MTTSRFNRRPPGAPLTPRPPLPATGAGAPNRLRGPRKLAPRVGLLRNKSDSDSLDHVEQKMLEHELAIAEELQANLLPHRIPQIPGYDLSAYYRPSREVGGDYYDFIEIDEGHLGICVADVSGKGIPGSIVMTETRALMKSEGVRSLSPAETLSRVNRVLHNDIKRGMFVTMYYMIIALRQGIAVVTSAGHNPMVLWRAATNTCHLVNPNGVAMGIDKGPVFEKTIAEQKVQLFRGDRFVLYTDGVVETMNAAQEEIGQRFYAKVRQLAARNSSEFLSLMVDDLEQFRGAAPQHDDITLVTTRLTPDAPVAEQSPPRPPQA